LKISAAAINGENGNNESQWQKKAGVSSGVAMASAAYSNQSKAVWLSAKNGGVAASWQP